MPRVQFFTTHSHYTEHLRPVYEALPEEVRGGFVHRLEHLAPDTLTVVSSWGNCKSVQGRGNPVVLFEHGAGFTYNVDHPSYAGGRGRDRVVLFCNVNERVDAANRAAYPNARHAIVGSPKLDAYVGIQPPETSKPTVAFSWHWNCNVAPETRSAFQFYRPHLQRTARNAPWTPLGHAHPRAWTTVQPFYRGARWPMARTFQQVVEHAAVYICDTSSTIYEFAALDRPVIILNAPWYRRNVHHGLRFWDDLPGIQVDHPQQLGEAIKTALTGDTWVEERRRITELVYPYLGNAAATAAAAIVEML
jgi:hypothetical protein